MIFRLTLTLVLAAAGLGACAPAPKESAPGTTETESVPITEETAIERAAAKADEMDYAVEGKVTTARDDGTKWIVNFVPEGRTVGGGFMVEIDKSTGEIVNAQFTQ